MERVRNLVPATALGKTRLAALVYAFVGIAPQLTQVSRQPNSAMILGMLPQLAAMGLLLRGLYALLTRLERAAARETLLARTGSRLLGRTDTEEVRAIVREAGATLWSQLPGVGMLVLRPDGDRVVVEGSFGFTEDVQGAVLPAACLEGLDPRDNVTVAGLGARSAAFDQLVGGRRQWRAAGLATPDVDRILLAGGTQRIPDEVFEAARTLTMQWSLAEANCGAHTELAHRAHHDQLTALPNRALFFQRLTVAVDAAKSGGDEISLLIVDLDDFKQVNDTYGHTAGDELLREVAERLIEVGGETAMPARFGGDEFALVLIGSRDATDRTADQLRERLLEPFRLTRATVSVGASIGVATATRTLTAGDLMRCADIAMYSAKAKGKNRVERFTAANHGEIAQVRLLEEHLAQAVERDEIVLHYQPQIDLSTGLCIGVEALVRWRHPALGLLSPARFIPMAEQTGQIIGLGEHVLRTACQQMARWMELPAAGALRVAVNVAPRQLVDPGFARKVRAALRDSGLPAPRLVLELTESELIDQQVAREQLRAVAELGIRIAIDDFGTGYASLASLRSFPVHQLKIDRSFLVGGEDADADAMFRLVISVGQILELETIVEGVETPAQEALLRGAGVALAQGYRFAWPMPAEDLPDWLAGTAQAATAPSPTLPTPS
jgi:diguanylate cyclase (GGDEF)-like protein